MEEEQKTEKGAGQAVVRLYGAPLSTFTRTIAMALHAHHIAFDHVKCLPHSEEARKHHPLGFIPILAHRPSLRPNDHPLEVYESSAIARYLDETLFASSSSSSSASSSSTSSSVSSEPAPALRTSDIRTNVRIDTLVSVASDQLFRRVEFGVVKPRLAMEAESTDEAEIQRRLHDGVQALGPVLSLLERELERSEGAYLVGKDITWADLYAYPALADLRSTPEGALLAQYPRLEAWMVRMEQREEAKRTYDGTVASQRQTNGGIGSGGEAKTAKY